ncbi:hypothetical protein AB0K16_09310 [Nonomuraea jabiensis]|uniref:hypothetical protein n=1 Tax=Nonomuraea jabiensis TaxID=882448 RepID=UPI0034268769
MMEVLGTIGSLAVVILLIVLSVLAVAVVALVVFGCMAGALLADWRGLWRRLTRLARGGPRLTLKRSGDAVPARLRAQLSGSTSGTRRRFLLGAGRSGERESREHGPGRGFSGARIRGHRPVDRHTRL